MRRESLNSDSQYQKEWIKRQSTCTSTCMHASKSTQSVICFMHAWVSRWDRRRLKVLKSVAYSNESTRKRRATQIFTGINNVFGSQRRKEEMLWKQDSVLQLYWPTKRSNWNSWRTAIKATTSKRSHSSKRKWETELQISRLRKRAWLDFDCAPN